MKVRKLAAVAAGCALLAGLLAGCFGRPPLANEQEIDLSDVNSIAIAYSSDSVNILQGSGNTLVLREYFSSNDAALFAQINAGGQAVSIRGGQRGGLGSFQSYIEVLLPKNYSGALALETTSGSIKIEADYSLAEFYAKSTSGSFRCEGLAVEGGFTIQTTSGSIRCGRLEGVMALESTSGSISVDRAEGGGSFATSSGSIKAEFRELAANITAASTSGSVTLQLPGNASFHLQASSNSGSVHTEFDGIAAANHSASGSVGANPQHTVDVSTTSGSIHINK